MGLPVETTQTHPDWLLSWIIDRDHPNKVSSLLFMLLCTFLKLDFDFWSLCFNNKGKDAAWTRSMSEWPNKGTMCQYWARDNTHCAPQNIVLKSAFVCKNQRQCQVHNFDHQFSTAATVSIQVQCLQQKVGCAVQPWTLGHQQPYLHPHNQNKNNLTYTHTIKMKTTLPTPTQCEKFKVKLDQSHT